MHSWKILSCDSNFAAGSRDCHHEEKEVGAGHARPAPRGTESPPRIVNRLKETKVAKQLFGTDGIRASPGSIRSIPPPSSHSARRWGARPWVPERSWWAPIRASPALGSRNWWRADWKRSGARVRYAGVVTTPGIAYLTRTGPFVAA